MRRRRDLRVLLNADAKKLDSLCHRVFGQSPSAHLDVAPVGDKVMLTFGSMNVSSSNSGHDPELNVAYDAMGHSPEKNAAVWVLTESSEDMATFVPAMWVDNPISLAGGREIYGFAKNWGSIALKKSEKRFSVDAYGGDFGAGESTGYHRLMTLTRQPKGGSVIDKALILEDAMGAVASEMLAFLKKRLKFGLGSDEQFLRHLFRELARRELRQVFLRQFRAPADNQAATPHDFVASVSKFSSVKVELLANRYRFELEDIDSHPIGAELGIGSQDVGYGLKISGDFVLDEGAFL